MELTRCSDHHRYSLVLSVPHAGVPSTAHTQFSIRFFCFILMFHVCVCDELVRSSVTRVDHLSSSAFSCKGTDVAAVLADVAISGYCRHLPLCDGLDAFEICV